MKSQIERRKEILMNEIDRFSQVPMNFAVAEKLSILHGALMALCEAEADGGKDAASYVPPQHKAATPAREGRSLRGWVEHMANADGTTGPHWTMDQASQLMTQKQISMDPEKFWAALNMIYSDYCMVAAKMGVNNIDFYACMALAFLDDADAVPDKLTAYYKHVACR